MDYIRTAEYKTSVILFGHMDPITIKTLIDRVNDLLVGSL